jgi:hypothetical protein
MVYELDISAVFFPSFPLRHKVASTTVCNTFSYDSFSKQEGRRERQSGNTKEDFLHTSLIKEETVFQEPPAVISLLPNG